MITKKKKELDRIIRVSSQGFRLHKTKTKKFIPLLLLATIILCALPFSVYALFETLDDPPIPPAPNAATPQQFANGATISDLVASGTNIQWYDSVTDGKLLSPDEQLGNGVTYYASQTVGGVVSSSRTAVTVKLEGPATVPDAPVIGVATAGNGQANVSFTAPASSGGRTITGYTVTSTPGGHTAGGGSSPITITGLTNGTAYTFTVTATNGEGTGAASAPSNSVTPTVASTPTPPPKTPPPTTPPTTLPPITSPTTSPPTSKPPTATSRTTTPPTTTSPTATPPQTSPDTTPTTTNPDTTPATTNPDTTPTTTNPDTTPTATEPPVNPGNAPDSDTSDPATRNDDTAGTAVAPPQNDDTDNMNDTDTPLGGTGASEPPTENSSSQTLITLLLAVIGILLAIIAVMCIWIYRKRK